MLSLQTVSPDMTYFEDAALQPMPYMLTDVSWDSIKDCILREVERFNKQLSR